MITRIANQLHLLSTFQKAYLKVQLKCNKKINDAGLININLSSFRDKINENFEQLSHLYKNSLHMFMILKTRELLSIQILKINVNEFSETFANLVIRQIRT